MSFNVGFVGGGNMSTAIFKGILNKEAHPVSNIWVSGPHLENLKYWKEVGANVTNKNGDVFDNCSVIFLGVKPSMLTVSVQGILETCTCEDKKVLFISMLAGVTIERLQKEVQVLSNNIQVIRILPNLPATVGAGACIYAVDSGVTPESCALAEKLLSSCCLVEKVSESMMDSLGSVVGCGPAFVYIMIEAIADGAVKQGVPRNLAQRMAAQMMMGSAKMVLVSNKHPGLLKDEVCSPGGTTICGLAVLEDGKIRNTLIKAIEASTLRSKELGKM